MGTRLSINDKIIILSNNLDGRWFAILNTYKLPHCRNVAVNINCISEYVGIKLGQALVPIIEVLSKNEKKKHIMNFRFIILFLIQRTNVIYHANTAIFQPIR